MPLVHICNSLVSNTHQMVTSWNANPGLVLDTAEEIILGVQDEPFDEYVLEDFCPSPFVLAYAQVVKTFHNIREIETMA